MYSKDTNSLVGICPDKAIFIGAHMVMAGLVFLDS